MFTPLDEKIFSNKILKIKGSKFFLGDFLIRLGIPSKGRMETETIEFLSRCGLNVRRKGRQYFAEIEGIPELQVVFQRQEDIVRGIETGLLTFGIAGADLVNELVENRGNVLIIHDALGFGRCTLEVAVPETWDVNRIEELKEKGKKRNGYFRVASKFPKLTGNFLKKWGIPFEFVKGAGTLEVSPALGNSEFIVDLVSTGQTLKDNRLKRIEGGCILKSEACFIGNKSNLKQDTKALQMAKQLLEIFEATIRAKDFVSVFANMRGNPEKIVPKLFEGNGMNGLQGPTVSSVKTRMDGEWFAIHIIVSKVKLMKTIDDLRKIGGSGVVVAPTLYIFEEEPIQFKQLLKNLGEAN